MPKTVKEIKAEVTALVKSQGNQGAISLGTVLDDIAELAGEGSGGGSTPNVIQISVDGEGWTIDNPDDLEGFAEKAEQGEVVILKMNAFDEQENPQTTYTPAVYAKSSLVSTFTVIVTAATNSLVMTTHFSIDVNLKTVTTTVTSYPSN